MISTLLFDLDGTLLNSLSDITSAVNHTLGAFGFKNKTEQEVCPLLGTGLIDLLRWAFDGKKMDVELNVIIDDVYRPYYSKHSNDKTVPYDGIFDMLKAVKKAGYKTAIVSNKRDLFVKDLKKTLFNDYIDFALGDTEGLNRKPAPDLVNLALSELKSKKEESVYIGDSEVDYETAVNSDLPLIACAWGFRGRKFLASIGAKNIIDHPSELLNALKGL